MLHPRASRRLQLLARAIPAVLLTGLFMVITGGVTASATPARELSPETYQGTSSTAALAGIAEFAEPVAKVATVAPERDVAAHTPAGSVVHPLDLYPLQGLLGDPGRTDAQSVPRSTDHNRGPPVTGQQ
ncbi:hypothetical protein [Phytoactinopolyspora mesophila]|uniref:Uncharacterized protein n=1 Tax=Phytoactinopolyspora mesophila TaxID=2650750 RepID=A0A7K3M6Y3_9ACTN|nr:hypothetical protein [Phytoactinopolyspora mesophila]NDL58168.1 hypothetical protein [Phytoactinopolyspora mesophila]